eukprot:NODE_231_length_3339_cov_15.953611.p1 GENE.NODE_231_length_3339_cov_15.953611~~NODE_231_length_3339_cov_15.953611.p1  ORF type:complete len:1023 (+),score=271.89 NODE_231_length_3339_cov_15.953611:133-3069(+)
MAVIRTDLLSHKLFAAGKHAMVVSMHMLQGRSSLQRWRSSAAVSSPTVRALEKWAQAQLLKYKEEEEIVSIWSSNVAREHQSLMNRMYFAAQYLEIAGISLQWPGTGRDNLHDIWHCMFLAGPDFVTRVPHLRWDADLLYSPDVDSWKEGKSHCRHGGFTDNVTAFDNRFFGISDAEARVMDPMQRLLLESSYDAFTNAGFMGRTLRDQSIACYIGAISSEWRSVMPPDSGAYGATAASPSIAAARIAFCLAIKGPTATVSTDGSSSLTALHFTAEALQTKGASYLKAGLAGGARILTAGAAWVMWCGSGCLSQKGRCFIFDASADGHVLTDCISLAVIQPFRGTDEQGSEIKPYGLLAGISMNTHASNVGLDMPSGPGLQQLVAKALENAHIAALDVDVVETHCIGSMLADAIEVGALVRSHRDYEHRDDALGLTSMKTAIGYGTEASGVAALIKVLMSSLDGLMMSTQHLSAVGPDVDISAIPAMVPSEIASLPTRGTFSGVMSRGFGGSNVYAIVLTPPPLQRAIGQATAAPLTDIVALAAPFFWPGGGSVLQEQLDSTGAYYICGTWSNWQNPTLMVDDGTGIHSSVVALGENCWELFQIWIDGDASSCLHPPEKTGRSDTPVLGPSNHSPDSRWLIDGRIAESYVEDEVEDGDADAEDAAEAKRPPGLVLLRKRRGRDGNGTPCNMRLYGRPTAESGCPGDRYLVRLHVAGKWRSISWIKLAPPEIHPFFSSKPRYSTASYYVASSASKWLLRKMRATEKPGCFSAEVQLTGDSASLFIVREKDWCQVIFPTGEDDVAWGPTQLEPSGRAWSLNGQCGDVFEVVLERYAQDGEDFKRVSITKLRSEPLKELPMREGYSMMGSWDAWQLVHPLRWTGSDFQIFLELGKRPQECFRVWHASPPYHAKSEVIDQPSLGSVLWTIGDDQVGAGARYDIRLCPAGVEPGMVARVTWTRLERDAVLDAEASELYLVQGR